MVDGRYKEPMCVWVDVKGSRCIFVGFGGRSINDNT